MPFFVNVFASAVIIGLVVMSILILPRILHLIEAETDLLLKLLKGTLLVIVSLAVICVIGIFAMFLVAGFASAAENPALPAPAEMPVVAEKPTASCPTEFNPDDSAWAMSKIDEFIPQKISDDLLAVEQIRYFSWFPDPEQRIFVGIKKLWNPDCVANLYSYGSRGDVDGKRILGAIKSSEKITVFLLTEKGWESGDDWETFTTDCGTKGCNLTFVLYRHQEPVASRTLFIRQVFHFRKPVE